MQCKICRKRFYTKPSHLKLGYGKFCSPRCQYKGQRTGKFVRCTICAKKIWRTPKDIRCSKSGKFFCNKSCQTLWRNRKFRGPRHLNWINGENIEHGKLLAEHGIKPLCKLCGCRDKRVLCVHHVDQNRKNNKLNNLVWLCYNCHHLVHCYGFQI